MADGWSPLALFEIHAILHCASPEKHRQKTRLFPHHVVELQSIVQHLTKSPPAPAVLATLVSVEGSSYRRRGARLLVTADGRRIGSISGGCLEEDLLVHARHVAKSGRAELVTYDTTSENDLVWGVGLGCNGIVKILVEPLPSCPRWAGALADGFRSHRTTRLSIVWQAKDTALLGTHLREEFPELPSSAEVFNNDVDPPPRLLVFGAGDDAQPLVRFAKELGWHVTIADPRANFATITRFPNADSIIVSPASESVRSIDPPDDALAVIMTHHYVHDVPLLRDLIPRSLPYVGLLGPKKRAAKIIADLQSQGFAYTAGELEALHAPVGLDLGAETPEEVALSIIAEIRAKLGQRDARPLRDRDRPIHD
jgi:xanthine/CO dehydrogenase XdhC/CoxF family maturation factor